LPVVGALGFVNGPAVRAESDDNDTLRHATPAPRNVELCYR
jgi:hypothetical protein